MSNRLYAVRTCKPQHQPDAMSLEHYALVFAPNPFVVQQPDDQDEIEEALYAYHAWLHGTITADRLLEELDRWYAVFRSNTRNGNYRPECAVRMMQLLSDTSYRLHVANHAHTLLGRQIVYGGNVVKPQHQHHHILVAYLSHCLRAQAA